MLQTLVDFDLAIEIGYHQALDEPLTLKHLFLLDVAPPATVQRRLRRLISLGLATKSFRPDDGRMVELRLSGKMEKMLVRYAAKIDKVSNGELSEAKNKAGGQPDMIRVVTKNMDERVCGTCAHWDGAREKLDGGACNFVEDGEGVCRKLASQGLGFSSTVMRSTQPGQTQCWEPCCG